MTRSPPSALNPADPAADRTWPTPRAARAQSIPADREPQPPTFSHCQPAPGTRHLKHPGTRQVQSKEILRCLHMRLTGDKDGDTSDQPRRWISLSGDLFNLGQRLAVESSVLGIVMWQLVDPDA